MYNHNYNNYHYHSKNLLEKPSEYRPHSIHFKNVSCVNCGERGHIVKECKRPITSFGIIAFKTVTDKHGEKDDLNYELNEIVNSYFIEKENYSKIKFLMIQRKDTMAFIDTMRGKYSNNDKEKNIKLQICFNEMTFTEKEKLKNAGKVPMGLRDSVFDSIWNYIWVNKSSRVYKHEYEKAKEKFNNLDINYYLQRSVKTFLHTEVGFPKGRRNMKETNISCAEREFTEETGFTKQHYDFIDNYPIIEESFIGTNNIEYKHLYYFHVF